PAVRVALARSCHRRCPRDRTSPARTGTAMRGSVVSHGSPSGSHCHDLGACTLRASSPRCRARPAAATAVVSLVPYPYRPPRPPDRAGHAEASPSSHHAGGEQRRKAGLALPVLERWVLRPENNIRRAIRGLGKTQELSWLHQVQNDRGV